MNTIELMLKYDLLDTIQYKYLKNTINFKTENYYEECEQDIDVKIEELKKKGCYVNIEFILDIPYIYKVVNGNKFWKTKQFKVIKKYYERSMEAVMIKKMLDDE
tara:strand:- start:13 stop:324 length:312 start_codon:yes stop_codon:yes gene_type:complete